MPILPSLCPAWLFMLCHPSRLIIGQRLQATHFWLRPAMHRVQP